MFNQFLYKPKIFKMRNYIIKVCLFLRVLQIDTSFVDSVKSVKSPCILNIQYSLFSVIYAKYTLNGKILIT